MLLVKMQMVFLKFTVLPLLSRSARFSGGARRREVARLLEKQRADPKGGHAPRAQLPSLPLTKPPPVAQPAAASAADLQRCDSNSRG